jgi:hypothetical protein
MLLKDFLQGNNFKPTRWAIENGIHPPILSLYLRGKAGLSAKTMAKIIAATGGQVTFADLVAGPGDGNRDGGQPGDGNGEGQRGEVEP